MDSLERRMEFAASEFANSGDSLPTAEEAAAEDQERADDAEGSE